MTWLMLAMLIMSGFAWAGEVASVGPDPVVEARLKQLATELRCLVCQNQTLADSNAPLAEDLRREIREMIANNMTDQQIIEFLVQRYGDFVLYRPPWKATTILLWLGPFLLLGIGAAALTVILQRRAKRPGETPLTDEERRQVERLLSEGEHP